MYSVSLVGGAQLFDIQADPSQNKDVAPQHPEVVKMTKVANILPDQPRKGDRAPKAEPGTVDVKSFRGLGILQHRRSYGYGTVVPFLWTCRSAVQPNRYSQTITGLEPGRLYSVKLITGDYHDLIFGQSAEKVHALSMEIQGADPLTGPEYSFIHSGKSTGTVGAFSTEHPYWMNQHCQVFRALGVDATVTITDWMTPSTPGGPIGQELIHSHIEVQPYYAESP